MGSKVCQFLTKYSRPSIRWVPILLFLVMLPIQPQKAHGNVSCHCFKERSFKPAQPASADPYILATTRNSLLAAAAGIDKGTVVRQRMTGATETDLWLSNYLSTRVDNRSADELLDARDKGSSWAAAFDAVGLDSGKLGTAFQTARKTDDADGMARSLADPVLGEAFTVPEPTLAQMRDAGANIAETALSLYLAGQLNQTPESIFRKVKEGKKTWGVLLNSLGIKIDTVGDLIAEAVRKAVNVNSER
ncbi:MAG: hypothetical protein RRA15_03970 [bacterium]|nr:hypothetical protein [bacterium]MDT8365633.1 hypothetical protein [bacterium]